ncbi:proteasome assembly chaperone 1 [Thrips palmi]|uniref:Proteasome assembly chaperone 1 n=1 Tax=Thrips palmi TaxID=161013 RepID=A0A6P9ABC8_THRPL|nr:proteasome assembly chaperone 1 [Thrips palmi]
MALFGEVVEPVSRSLYVDESSDEEDAQEESLAKTGTIQWVDEASSSIDTLLIFHGRLAADFLLKILHGTKSTKAGHLKERLFGKPSKEPNILLYKLSNNIYGCLCPSIDIASSNGALDKLIPVFNSCKQLVIIATVPAPFYKGNDPTLDLPPAFMRMLYTSTCDSHHAVAPLLEPPNMVSGIPASILNWCEIFKKPGCLFVCYSDSHHLDSISAEPMVTICSNVFEGLFEPQVLTFQSAAHEPTSNLYM